MKIDARAIAEKVFQFYDTLPKRGKPCSPEEWTTLASFLLVRGCDVTVVSCTTGTRCLGGSLLDEAGHRLHDSHAEVLARRALQRFLMSEVAQIYQGCSKPDSVFEMCAETAKVRLQSDIEVILFSTQTPCGDASIYVRPEGDVHPSRKRSLDMGASASVKRSKTGLSSSKGPVEDDLYRTGAKCVPRAEQDELLPGLSYHVTGVLRTKPGRGDPTQSLSCSDKIARWNLLGCQGSLLMIFFDRPIYIDHIVLAGCSYDEEALKRALYGRLSAPSSGEHQLYTLHSPSIFHTDVTFHHSKQRVEQSLAETDKAFPCATSLIWYKLAGKGVKEVGINGYRQGVTKKGLKTPAARLSICRSSIFKELHRIFSLLDEKARLALLSREDLPVNYMECKSLTSYTQVWNQLAANHKQFKTWPRKELRYSSFTVGDA